MVQNTILIVDDDEGVLGTLKMLFEEIGWRVVTTRLITLVQPVFEAEADQIACIFWDGTLDRVPRNERDEGAEDCFRRLAHALQERGIPFVLTDGVYDREREVLTRSAGMLKLPKPFTLGELEAFLLENIRPE